MAKSLTVELHTWAEVKVVEDDLDELLRGLVGGAVGLDEEGEGLRDTDGVRQLDKCTAGQLGVYERLGDPAREVGGGAIDLGVVLARESTTTVGSPAAVGVDDDLTASEASITLWSTDDEEAGGLDLELVRNVLREKGADIRGRRSCRRGGWRE